jgi:hypothetical protein
MNKRFQVMYDALDRSWYVYEDLTPSHKAESDERYHHVWIRNILTPDAAHGAAEFLQENTNSLRSFSRDRP